MNVQIIGKFLCFKPIGAVKRLTIRYFKRTERLTAYEGQNY